MSMNELNVMHVRLKLGSIVEIRFEIDEFIGHKYEMGSLDIRLKWIQFIILKV